MRLDQKMDFSPKMFSKLSFGGCPFPADDSRNRLKTEENLLWLKQRFGREGTGVNLRGRISPSKEGGSGRPANAREGVNNPLCTVFLCVSG